MQHDPNAHTQVTEVALPAELTEPLPDDASTVTIVARTAAETALGVPGVHHLGGIAARAADQLRKQLGRSAGTAGVQVDEDDGALGVQVSIVVSYPEPVLHVADEVRKQVMAATRQLSELPTSVDVRVLDVHGPFDDEQSPLGRATEAATDAVVQAGEASGEAVKQAAETTKRVVETAADTTEDVRDAAAESLARASEQAADAASSAKDAAEQAGDVVVDAAQRTKDRADDAVETVRDAASTAPADRAASAADAAADAADAAEDAASAAADSADAAAAETDAARHRREQP